MAQYIRSRLITELPHKISCLRALIPQFYAEKYDVSIKQIIQRLSMVIELSSRSY
jgi:hypothetical protein